MQNRFSPQLLSENTEVRIILLVMCFETWSSTLREEVGCVVENVKLRKVFRPKTGEVTGCWQISDSELLHDVGSSPNNNRGTGEVLAGFCWGNLKCDTAWKTT
jgi:hypothetical protein